MCKINNCINFSRIKKYLVIQVDGFSKDECNKSIKSGSTPFLKHLKEKQKFQYIEIKDYTIPAATGERQKEIMLDGKGVKFPGQTFYSKKDKSICTVYGPKYIKNLEDKSKNGILEKHGRSIANTYCAGAKENFLVISDLERFLSSLFISMEAQEKKKIPIYAKIIFRILLYLLIVPFILFPLDFIYHLVKNTKKGAVLISIFSMVVGDKYSTYATIYDIKNKDHAEITYVNFLGYDTTLHHFGQKSIFSKTALFLIDRRIRKIYKTVKKKGISDYDVFILSDHGQTESIPFEEHFGETFCELLQKILNTEVIDGTKLKIVTILNETKTILEELEDVKYPRFVKIVISVVNIVLSHLHYNFPGEHSIVFSYQGSVGHLNLNIKNEKLNQEEIERYYPELINTLKNHKGLRFLTFLTKNGVKILRKKREILIDKEEKIKENDDLLMVIDDKDGLFNSLVELAKDQNSGDIIVFGAEIGDKTITFENFKSSHGGIEKNEQETFVLAPSVYKNDLKGIKSLKELHSFFYNLPIS